EASAAYKNFPHAKPAKLPAPPPKIRKNPAVAFPIETIKTPRKRKPRPPPISNSRRQSDSTRFSHWLISINSKMKTANKTVSVPLSIHLHFLWLFGQELLD